MNDVFPSKFRIADQISPHLRFDVESCDCVVTEDIACILERHDMRIVGEDLVRHWIHHLAFIVLRKVQFYQVRNLERLSSNRVCAMLVEPKFDVVDVKYCPVRCAYWILEGLQGYGTKVKR